jgi:DNA-binding response OmpR family regulator
MTTLVTTEVGTELTIPPAERGSSPLVLRVLAVLVESHGRVVSRTELLRRAGLRGLSPRRVDVLLVDVRRIVGDAHLVNVRGRGWMLTEVSAEARALADVNAA